MSMQAIEDVGEAADAPLVVSEYWPSAERQDGASGSADAPPPPVKVSWWEQTNWFRVQEKRQQEQQFEQQQRALGRTVPPAIPAATPSGRAHPASYAVSHPLHDDDDAAVEYGGIGEDGAQLGDRYIGKAQRGIGSNIGSGSTKAATSAPMTEQQRLAIAPGGAEVFCRFNTTPRTPSALPSPPATVAACTTAAVAVPAPSGATASVSAPAPSLMARSESGTRAKGPAATAATKAKAASTRLRLACIQGYDNEVKRKLHELVVLPLFHPSLFSSLGVRAARGVILAGASGAGKSNLVRALVHELGHKVYFQHVDAAHLLTEVQHDLASHKGGDARNMESTLGVQNSGTGLGAPREHGTDVISKLFAACRKNAPALLFIDEVDVVASERKHGEQPLLAKIRALLKINLDRLNESNAPVPVIVIGATNHPEALDPALLRVGRFDRIIQLNKPDEKGRGEILRHCTREMRMDPMDRQSIVEEVAGRTQGFVGSDLANLCTEAGLVCIREFMHEQAQRQQQARDGDAMDEDEDEAMVLEGVTPVPLLPADPATLSSLLITRHHFIEALKSIKPSSSRSFGSEALQPIQWNEVGGTKEIKNTLLETIEQPLLFPHLFHRFGMAPSSGVLLYGPPGCGKTLMARAIANRAKASFLSVKGPELLSSYLGESEQNVRKLFAQARAASPCVLFFDEIDSIALSRSGAHGGGEATGDRVLNQLLTEMDARIMGGGGEEQPKKEEKKKGQNNADSGKTEGTAAAPATSSSDADTTMSDASIATASASPAPSPRSSRPPVPVPVRTPAGSAAPIVFVVAATNRPDLLDPALLRPGRLDQLLFVGLPNSESRFDILRTLLAQTPCEEEMVRDDYAALRSIAESRCRGLSGADLAHVCNLARKYAINEFLARQRSAGTSVPRGGAHVALDPASDRVTLGHLDRALSEVHPSVSAEVLEKYRLFNLALRQRGESVTTVNEVPREPDEDVEAVAAGADHMGDGGVEADAGSMSALPAAASSSSSAPASASSSSALPRASASQLNALRDSFRKDISAKLASLGPGVDSQQAMNQILASLLKETNAGAYKLTPESGSTSSSSGSSSSSSSSASMLDAPVSLASSNASQVPPRARKAGGREK